MDYASRRGRHSLLERHVGRLVHGGQLERQHAAYQQRHGAITNGGTATISQAGEVCNYLYLGSAQAGTIQMTGGALTVSNIAYVGNSGTGTFTQSGGTNTVSSVLYLGMYGGGSGTYNLSGGTLAAQQISGGTGTSTFNFDGGLLQAGTGRRAIL